VETSIVSYLTARPAHAIVAAAHQQVTRDWWEKERSNYDLYVSDLVLLEASRGDAGAARARLDVLASLHQLAPTPRSEAMVPILLRETRLSIAALADMSHVAIASVHGMQYLLTWNCKHLANARIIRIVERVCRNAGVEPPVLCTPTELLGLPA
jgi:hypothetical protein